MNTREKIVAALEAAKGDYISGEELAESIGVSRNSVWKAIKTLKEQGYNIDAVTNKGYKLSSYSDIISREGISLYLKDKKLADCIEVYDEIGSTNDLAKKYLYSDIACMTDGSESGCHIIIAKEQTGGRGHNKSSFPSPKGGIYMSVVLPADQAKVCQKKKDISKHTREAVIKTVVEISGIKLEEGENHGLYHNKAKICGLLTEVLSDYEDGNISEYIIGIGIRYDDIALLSDRSDVTRNRMIAEILNKLI